MPIINIDMDAAAKFSDKLRTMHRSALPVAVRGALNKAAFDVKQRTMPGMAKHVFAQRSPNFFKATSRVDPAKGFQIRAMMATVGFLGKDQAVEDLEQQEHGGKIGGRSFITTRQARTSGSWQKRVKADLRIGKLKDVIDTKKVKFKGAHRNPKQRFVRAAIQAKKLHGKNAFVLGNKWQGNRTVSRIDRITFNRKKRTIKIKRTPVYTYRPNRKVSVARTNFMRRASLESGMSLERHFQNEAIKQLKKLHAR